MIMKSDAKLMYSIADKTTIDRYALRNEAS